MSAPPSELTRMIKARPLPADPVVIEASAEERAALAARFGLGAVQRLRAEVTLDQKARAIRATGRLRAQIMQPCAISAEDFPVSIDAPIDLRFVEDNGRPMTEDDPGPASGAWAEIELEADDCDEIAFTGEMFDLGEAVAQTLGLAIDPYAEGPNADAARKAAGIVAEGENDGPMAAMLAALKKD
ncbi:MAG: DNA-binding protein [Alphaproteobacteria bacterium HGW-Alphaproteobacteria-14]|nr:MAG: DNA-binding protein [Alphaproteobacteria bacterium HGW-Alphaproteobacteria-14]